MIRLYIKVPQSLRSLAVLNTVVVWAVCTRPPTSKSSSPFSNPLVTVPNAPIIIDIIVTFMFHSFFNKLNVDVKNSLMGSHWSLKDRRSPQVAKTLRSIPTDLINVVVWTVSTLLVICMSSSPCTNPLVTVPRTSITNYIIATFMFHSFFNSLTRSMYLSFFLLLWSAGTAKSTIWKILFFFFVVDYYKLWLSGQC